MRVMLYGTLLFMFACGHQATENALATILIVDEKLEEAYRDAHAAMTEERTPIEFQGGKFATDCSSYIELKHSHRLAEGTNNQIIKGEYLVCEALDLLEAAKTSDIAPPISLESLYTKLDLRTFPSALRPQLQGDIKTLEQLSGSIVESTRNRLTVDVNGVQTTFMLAAIADVNGNGEDNWILWMAQTIAEGNYHNYQTLTITAPDTKGGLIGAH
jgi:hypothetical protein